MLLLLLLLLLLVFGIDRDAGMRFVALESGEERVEVAHGSNGGHGQHGVTGRVRDQADVVTVLKKVLKLSIAILNSTATGILNEN